MHKNWVCSPWKRALSCYEILQFTRNYIYIKDGWGFFLPFNNSYFDVYHSIFFTECKFWFTCKHTCIMYKYSIVYYWLFYAYRCQTTVVAPLQSKVETITQDIILRNPTLSRSGDLMTRYQSTNQRIGCKCFDYNKIKHSFSLVNFLLLKAHGMRSPKRTFHAFYERHKRTKSEIKGHILRWLAKQ